MIYRKTQENVQIKFLLYEHNKKNELKFYFVFGFHIKMQRGGRSIVKQNKKL